MYDVFVRVESLSSLEISDKFDVDANPPLHRFYPLFKRKSDELVCPSLLTLSDSRGIQTHNLLIRSQMLYSVELGSHPFRLRLQRYAFFKKRQNFFATFLSK